MTVVAVTAPLNVAPALCVIVNPLKDDVPPTAPLAVIVPNVPAFNASVLLLPVSFAVLEKVILSPEPPPLEIVNVPVLSKSTAPIKSTAPVELV